MADNKLDAVLLTGGVNLAYFTTVSWGTSERTFAAILNKKGRPIWVCPAFELERAKELIPAGHDVRTWEEHESPYRLIGQVMADLGARAGRLGVGPSTAGFQIFGLKQDAPQVELADGAVVTEGCRGTKTAKEIAFMDLANRITKLAYREGFKQIKEGMSPARPLRRHRRRPHPDGSPRQRRPAVRPRDGLPARLARAPQALKPGDTIMVDGGCSVEGFSSDVTRTIVFGKADGQAAEGLGHRQEGPGRRPQGRPSRREMRGRGRGRPQGHRGRRLRPGIQVFRPPASATASAWKATSIPISSRGTPSRSFRA